MESNIRYFSRRANQEALAARHAVTPAARERRLLLAEMFNRRASELRG